MQHFSICFSALQIYEKLDITLSLSRRLANIEHLLRCCTTSRTIKL